MGVTYAFQFTLYPGHTIRPGFTWHDPNGGPAFVECREFKESTRGNWLKVSAFTTVRNPSNNEMDYYITITNEGPQVAVFQLMIGTF